MQTEWWYKTYYVHLLLLLHISPCFLFLASNAVLLILGPHPAGATRAQVQAFLLTSKGGLLLLSAGHLL